MNDADDEALAALARRFLDLWQRQLVHIEREPASWPTWAALFASPALPPPLDISRQSAHGPTPTRADHTPPATQDSRRDAAAAPRAAAAAPAHDAGEHGVGELARRLAACEERLAALERALAATRTRPRSRPRGRRS